MGSDAPVGGVSRRRVIVGTAWATPAILIGVSAPRAAASMDNHGTLGVTYSSIQFIDGTYNIGGDVNANSSVTQASLNGTYGAGAQGTENTPDLTSLTLTFVITGLLDTDDPPVWGFSNLPGNDNGGGWVASSVTTSDDGAQETTTVVLTYGGTPLSVGDPFNLNSFFVETGNTSGQTVMATITGTDADGYTWDVSVPIIVA